VDSVLAGRQRRKTVPEGQPTLVSASHLHYAARMKTSTLPAVRVAPALRRDAEAVLDEGESLCDGRRKAARPLNDRQRELIVPFGSSGLIAAFEVRGDTVRVGAIRHQLTQDFR
jgi:hypothetical protein